MHFLKKEITLLPLRHTENQDFQNLPLLEPVKRWKLVNRNLKDLLIFPFLKSKNFVFQNIHSKILFSIMQAPKN